MVNHGVGTSFWLELIKTGGWSLLLVGASESRCWSILSVGVDKSRGWRLLLVVAREYQKLNLHVDVIF